MFSLEIIKKMNDKATEKAEQYGFTPYIAKCNGDIAVRGCRRLGNSIPKGWKLVKTYFVDNSGFGSEGELALTFEQFLTKVKNGYGYAIGEVGQFQIYINEYKRI